MIVPESWLRSFCNPKLPGAKLAERLTMAGVEVESYEPAVPAIAGVVAAEVRAVDKHPNADKLTVCSVRAGGATYRVVCGAPNVRVGQRSISALVDVTNYVMLELGRPLHVYDLDKLRGAIDVRWGRKGEKVLLLNGEEVDVDPSVLCITDDSGAIGLAGIMGGESTKADEVTKNIFLESAFFYPDAIAGRARRYNFASDASHRFERGVDFDSNVDGIERATRLVLEICGGEPGPTADKVARLPKRKPVAMRVARAQKVIGIAIPAKE